MPEAEARVGRHAQKGRETAVAVAAISSDHFRIHKEEQVRLAVSGHVPDSRVAGKTVFDVGQAVSGTEGPVSNVWEDIEVRRVDADARSVDGHRQLRSTITRHVADVDPKNEVGCDYGGRQTKGPVAVAK